MNRSKILYAIMLLLCAQVFVVTTQAQTTPADIFSFPEIDFATPEEAIEHFVASIAKNDVVAALQAFAINAQAQKMSFTAMSERLGVIQMAQTLSPTEYPMYIELNRLELVSRYARQIKLFSYSLLLQTTESFEEFDPYITIPIQDKPDLVRDFVSASNPEKLTSLKISKLLRIVATSDKLLDIGQQQSTPLGADEVTELVILYELEGNYYLGGARVLRYGESWGLEGLHSTLAGTSSGGDVTLTTPEDFEILIDELGNNESWKLKEIPQ